MANTKHIQENVIQSAIPSPIPSGDSPFHKDDALLNIGPASRTNTESLAGGHVSATEGEELPTDQTIICVICLELVGEAATALPCRHNHFHFSCLGTWLQQNRSCPLCKVEVISVRYYDQDLNSTSVFYLPEVVVSRSVPRHRARHSYSYLRRSTSRRLRRDSSPETECPALQFRRRVYEQGLYSLYVGNNRISRYRNITHTLIAHDAALQSRAKKWIRRELRALVPFQQQLSSAGSSQSANSGSGFRNNEFLLEYVIAILKNIDIKGSAGQAEVLLREHLGRKTARLFLHELENWMRSPFETLEDWDEFVQYSGT